MVRFRSMIAVAFVGLLLVGTLAFAQGPGGRRGGPLGPGLAPGMQLRGLDLTDAQRTQIQEITQRYMQQMRAEVMQVLTPEQQEKVNKAQEARTARLQQRLQRRQNNQN
jgi:Spy/CpxP family protein refolding chaperone